MSGPAEWYTPLPTKEDVVDVLRLAKGLIQDRGWVQGQVIDADGRLCLEAAIRIAAESSGNSISDQYHRGADAVFVMHRCLGIDPYRWNDQPGRTQKQALDALEQAARQIETFDSGRDAIFELARLDLLNSP